MKTLVVKIGTSTLVRGGHVDENYISDVARQIALARAEGWRAVVVSSGAVRAGLDVLGRARALKTAEKQAAAAVGQSLLMRAYRVAFAAHDLHVAQILLTRDEMSNRRRFVNARHTFAQLFKWDVVPVVNENDSVATDEIRVGDNDTLAALTGLICEADKVLLLSDVDGFYLPGQSKPLARVEAITPEIENAAGGAGSVGGTGGMRTKIEAARMATSAGVDLVIAHGRGENIIARVARGEEVGTCFCASGKSSRSRKSWIAHGRKIEGVLHLNRCARAALHERGSSLLPVGIERVEGQFDAGALVLLSDERGEVGRGLSNFAADDLRRIAGRKSSELTEVLGRELSSSVAVHRDNLSLA